MKLKTICHVAAAVTAVGLAYCASAQTTSWLGTDLNGQWNDPGNWSAGVPTNTAGAVAIIDPQAGPAPTIPAGYACSIGTLSDHTTTWGTIYGPEWGQTLNIQGELDYDWMMAPVQNYWPNGRTMINIDNGGILQCVGDATALGAGIGIGDAWWWFADAPYVTLNMYGNAQLITPNIGLGGHLNIYDTAAAYVGADVFTGNPLMGDQPGATPNQGQTAAGPSSVLGTGNQGTIVTGDVTASLNLGGGTLVLSFNYTNETAEPGNTLYDLVNRGVIRFYGKGYDTNADGTLKDATLTYNATNTFATNILSTNVIVVTCVPLGTLSQIYYQPLLGSPANTLRVGTIQQAQLVGDYSPVTGVLLSSPEPGIDLNGVAPVYSSSNPSVLTVNANGIVTAVSAGTATLTASYGGKNSPALTVTVVPVTPTLVNRFSFSEPAGSLTVTDSIAGAIGTLNSTATINGTGQLVLDGTKGCSVSLPPGILTNMDEVTIEVWATFPGAINPYANLFAFGNTDLGLGDPNYGDGYDYVTCSPHTGASPNTVAANFGPGDPGFTGEFANDVTWTGVLDNQTNVQVVAVWHPLAASSALYTNGTLLATGILWNDMTDPVAYNGNGSILKWALHKDPNNYIGQSLYTGDPGLLANIDEFRIYNGPLTAAQIAADNALGPNQLRGTSTSVKLSINGSDPVISWPTTSALVQLLSSPTLGPGAVWTPMNMSGLTVVGSNYQMTVPVTGSAMYYRLEL
jgi:hypothetical protein